MLTITNEYMGINIKFKPNKRKYQATTSLDFLESSRMLNSMSKRVEKSKSLNQE